MTPVESAASLLRRAADRVEQAATGTTPGPWAGYVADDPARAEVFAGPFVHGYLTGCAMAWPEEACEEYGGQPSHEDMAWLSLMGPQIAGPLASWLRAEADMAANPLIVYGGAQVPLSSTEPYAVALALALLGETPNGTEVIV